jgi:hypothetical protein
VNEHDIDLIASALNRLRPDWPMKSIRTLIATRLADRPMRDVAVALTWVACEPNSSTPARVLEAGPWWRAVAIEGQANRREPYDAARFCGICNQPEDRCRRVWAPTGNPERDDAMGRHEFIAADRLRAINNRPPEANHLIAQAVRAELHPTPDEGTTEEKR